MATKVRNHDGLFSYIEGLKVKKIHPTAEELSKNNPSDFFYEVTITGRDENRVEDVQGDVNVFTTGLVIEAPKNSHIEILEHPQLYKAGYTLQGGVRLYNSSSDGELLIPLFKFKDVEDIELPFRAALIVIRQTEYTHVEYQGASKHSDEEDEAEFRPSSSKKKGHTSQTKSSKKKGGNHMF